MRLRKIEIVEGSDGTGIVTVTVANPAEAEASYTFAGKLGFGLHVRESGFLHADVSVSPVTPKQESTQHNNPTGRYT